MERVLRNVSLAGILGAIVMFLSSLVPTASLALGGSRFASYGFPLTYFRPYFLDGIGPGAYVSLMNGIADFFFWAGMALIGLLALDGFFIILRKRVQNLDAR
jgi:hypothetical protein